MSISPMSLNNAINFSSAGRNHQGSRGATVPRLNAKQEYKLLMTAIAVFLAGSTGVVLFALSALGL
jgi:hypothetical protein